MALIAEVKDVFGTIKPPESISKFIGSDPTGDAGISKLLSNFISLIYIIAAVILVLMLVWGAFDWLTSAGEKEKVHAAQQKIMSAIIGILLFAVTFAVITVLGLFTGFEFFKGQGQGLDISVNTDPNATYRFHCRDGQWISQQFIDGKLVTDPKIACGSHGYNP